MNHRAGKSLFRVDDMPGEDTYVDGQAIQLGFYMNAEHLFGIPERANTFLLNSTVGEEPYRLFN